MCRWLSNKPREHLWNLINNQDNNSGKIIESKLVKQYEIISIISGLICTSLISISDSQNTGRTVIIIYDISRGTGIILSVLCANISIIFAILIGAAPHTHMFQIVKKTSPFMSCPIILLISSLSSLLTCATLHFKPPTIYVLIPLSIFSFLYSFYFYCFFRTYLFDSTIKDTKQDIL